MLASAHHEVDPPEGFDTATVDVVEHEVLLQTRDRQHRGCGSVHARAAETSRWLYG